MRKIMYRHFFNIICLTACFLVLLTTGVCEAYHIENIQDIYNVRSGRYFNGRMIYGYIPEEACVFIAIEDMNGNTITAIYARNDEIVSTLYNGKNDWLNLYTGLPLSNKAPKQSTDSRLGTLLSQKNWFFKNAVYGLDIYNVPGDNTGVCLSLGQGNAQGKLIRGCVFDIRYQMLVDMYNTLQDEQYSD